VGTLLWETRNTMSSGDARKQALTVFLLLSGQVVANAQALGLSSVCFLAF